jgi:predicted dinucleotide-binding enzyme
MRVGVLGTGMAGPVIAGKLSALEHDVVVGTRDPVELMERTEPGSRRRARRRCTCRCGWR